MGTPANSPTLSAADELRRIPTFADLDDDALDWLLAHSEVIEMAPGDSLFREGDLADWMFVVLEGEGELRRPSGAGDAQSFPAGPGTITGMLPYSRLQQYAGTARAVTPARVLRVHKDRFQEMLQRIPELAPRLVALLVDRTRAISAADQQRDRLAALGKLSAGLAHELNNPAAAARRGAQGLRETLAGWRSAAARLTLTAEQQRSWVQLEAEALGHIDSPTALDPLDQSDREEALANWLQDRGLDDPWQVTTALVEAGLDGDALARHTDGFDGPTLDAALCRLTATVAAERLAREIEASVARISELVRSIKEYTYMDQSAEQEVDVHEGLESTLTMLAHQLRGGVAVEREYDRTLPRLCARGSALNQVWTNLIDNAADAMGGQGTLRIRTARDLDRALIEITDSGPGIPPNVQPRLFEPFFTTKEPGQGTGLGLDTVRRIIQQHRGEVRFQSKPGETRFQVYLPLDAVCEKQARS